MIYIIITCKFGERPDGSHDGHSSLFLDKAWVKCDVKVQPEL